MTSSPVGPSLGAGQRPAGFDDEGCEEPADLVAGQRDEPGGCGLVGVLLGGDHGEQGVRQHREQSPAPPGGPAADLVLIEPGQAFAGLEGFLDGPPAAGDADQLTQRDELW